MFHRTILAILTIAILSGATTAQPYPAPDEMVFQPHEFSQLIGQDALFIRTEQAGAFLIIVPLKDINIRQVGNSVEAYVKAPLLSFFPTPGFSARGGICITAGHTHNVAWATSYAIPAGEMAYLVPPSSVPTFTGVYKCTIGVTHTVSIPQRKYRSGWERVGDWRDRYDAALRAVLENFPPVKP